MKLLPSGPAIWPSWHIGRCWRNLFIYTPYGITNEKKNSGYSILLKSNLNLNTIHPKNHITHIKMLRESRRHNTQKKDENIKSVFYHLRIHSLDCRLSCQEVILPTIYETELSLIYEGKWNTCVSDHRRALQVDGIRTSLRYPSLRASTNTHVT